MSKSSTKPRITRGGAGKGRVAPPWTEAHRREAWARLHEIAADVIRGGDLPPSTLPHAEQDTRDEGDFRFALRHGLRLDAARIDREVRRVRGLAEGRLVRSVAWFLRYRDGTESPCLVTMAQVTAAVGRAEDRGAAARIVRVTRIRRA